MSEPRTLLDWIDSLRRYGERAAIVAFTRADARELSYQRLDDLSRRLAAGLIDRGVDRGDRVALLAPSSPEWMIACLGILRAGGMPVPLDIQFDDDALTHVLTDSRPRMIFVNANQQARLGELRLDLSPQVILLDAEDDPDSWRQLLAEHSGELPSASPDDEAVLFYTSGTTGSPKGVPLTQRNLAVQLQVLLNAGLVRDDDRVLLPLPLHHVYPVVVGMLTPLALGLPIVLPYSLTGPQMMRALQEAQVTIVIGVPRLYRALDDAIQGRIRSSGRVAGGVIQGIIALSAWLRRRLNLRMGKWLLYPLHQRLGPHLRVVACGGSPLDDDLAWRLEALGWQVAIGYGLTETSPLLTINPPGSARIGTVGKPIPPIELRIDDNDEGTGPTSGEILARGPSVFGGYRNLPEQTAAVLTEEGWFHTGDLGFIDADGYLHVTGRRGTRMVTAGGENVQPSDVENAYAQHPEIDELGVLEDEGQLVALIVPNNRARDRDDWQEAIASAVEAAGRELPSYQRLGGFRVTRGSLPRTRLGKIQRHKLRERYARAGDRDQGVEQAPVEIAEMNSEDRALLSDPAASQTWEYLTEQFSAQRLTPETNIRADLGVDSLEWMNLSLAIRRRAGVEVDEAAIEQIETVRDLLRETSRAAAADPEPQASLLDDPESALSEHQQAYLRPLGRGAEYASAALFTVNRWLMRLLFQLEVQGADRLPADPFVITPNHVSYLDAPVIAAALTKHQLRNTYWGGWTGTMFRNFLMRRLSRLTRVVPVDPQRGAVSSLACGGAVLDRGHHLVWFPEGQRSDDGRLQSFRPGIGWLLKDRPVWVVPVAVEGTFAALPPGRWLLRPRQVRVRFGRPLRSTELIPDQQREDGNERDNGNERDDGEQGEQSQAAPQQLATALRDRVAALVDEDPLK